MLLTCDHRYTSALYFVCVLTMIYPKDKAKENVQKVYFFCLADAYCCSLPNIKKMLLKNNEYILIIIWDDDQVICDCQNTTISIGEKESELTRVCAHTNVYISPQTVSAIIQIKNKSAIPPFGHPGYAFMEYIQGL